MNPLSLQPQVSSLQAARTLVEVARLLGVSRSRVWQIERRALGKLRRAIECAAAADGVSPREWLSAEENP